MKLYHIVAVSRNGVIGKDNQLPWRFSSDLKHFKEITMGHTVIMGRKTFESIGKPLPNRENFVLSRQKKNGEQGISFFSSIDEAFSKVKSDKAFIIGGGDLYRQTLDRIDGIYLTRIQKDYEGDTFYPKIPDSLVEKRRDVSEENQVKLEFIYLEKSKVRS